MWSELTWSRQGLQLKERLKSHFCNTEKEIKIWERSFLYRSFIFCPTCHKCPHCCSESTCRGQTEPVLQNLGHPRCQRQNHKNPEGRLHPPLPEPTNFDQVSNNDKWLCQSPQQQLPDGGITCTYSKECSRNSPRARHDPHAPPHNLTSLYFSEPLSCMDNEMER